MKQFPAFMMWTSAVPHITDMVIALFSVVVLTKE
jgi:hypothetical protein